MRHSLADVARAAVRWKERGEGGGTETEATETEGAETGVTETEVGGGVTTQDLWGCTLTPTGSAPPSRLLDGPADQKGNQTFGGCHR